METEGFRVKKAAYFLSKNRIDTTDTLEKKRRIGAIDTQRYDMRQSQYLCGL
jgi:hypothetical protein